MKQHWEKILKHCGQEDNDALERWFRHIQTIELCQRQGMTAARGIVLRSGGLGQT